MTKTLEERFWTKVEVPYAASECWLWVGSRDSKGYGRLANPGKSRLPHRIAYELMIGPIPPGIELDHLCREKACVNPWHLEQVTHRENSLRGVMADRPKKTHCPHGHEYTEANTYYIPGKGTYMCRICRTNLDRKYKKQKAQRAKGIVCSC
jgi:HNH endonuclease